MSLLLHTALQVVESRMSSSVLAVRIGRFRYFILWCMKLGIGLDFHMMNMPMIFGR